MKNFIEWIARLWIYVGNIIALPLILIVGIKFIFENCLISMQPFILYFIIIYVFCILVLLLSSGRIECEKVQIGKKYRISFKDGNKVTSICALIVSNDVKKKILKFETKENLYNSKWNKLKIKSLMIYKLKLVLWILMPLLAFLFINVCVYYWYRNPECQLDICKQLKVGEICEKVTWECDGWKCDCKYEECLDVCFDCNPNGG